MMAMNFNMVYLAKVYLFPTIIIIAAMELLKPWLMPFFGVAFGTLTTYIVSGMVIMMALWFARKTEKAVK